MLKVRIDAWSLIVARLWDITRITVVIIVDSSDEYSRAVRRFPPEHERECHLPVLRPHKAVVLEPGLREQLRQPGRVAERVGIGTDRRGHANMIPKVSLPVERLPDEALGRRNIAVGLHDPPVDRLHAVFGDPLLDDPEQSRIGPLDPPVMRG